MPETLIYQKWMLVPCELSQPMYDASPGVPYMDNDVWANMLRAVPVPSDEEMQVIAERYQRAFIGDLQYEHNVRRYPEAMKKDAERIAFALRIALAPME